MKSENYEEIYQESLHLLEENEFSIKEYFTNRELALWVLTVYNMFNQVKVITSRLQNLADISVIVSHTKLSVIINDIEKSSYIREQEIIKYEDIQTDILNLLTLLEIVFIKADEN